MALQDVKAFYQRLANDETFRSQIQGVKSKEECSQIVKAAGYNFTLQEYEEYTAQLLEAGSNQGELNDLSEKELADVFGGLTGKPTIQPLYGVVWPSYQLLYGVIRPNDVV